MARGVLGAREGHVSDRRPISCASWSQATSAGHVRSSGRPYPQIRLRHSDGRTYYDCKIVQGETHKEALRCLKRRISDALFARLVAEARRAAVSASTGPGRQTGNDFCSSAAGSHPERRLFGKATPGPEPTIRPLPDPEAPGNPTAERKLAKPLDYKEDSFWRAARPTAACLPKRSRSDNRLRPTAERGA
ncbi:MAG: transposase [Acidimicrobiaceae bacterium]|nr:transposase [Acidimicrobiaceae bacterium]